MSGYKAIVNLGRPPITIDGASKSYVDRSVRIENFIDNLDDSQLEELYNYLKEDSRYLEVVRKIKLRNLDE